VTMQDATGVPKVILPKIFYVNVEVGRNASGGLVAGTRTTKITNATSGVVPRVELSELGGAIIVVNWTAVSFSAGGGVSCLDPGNVLPGGGRCGTLWRGQPSGLRGVNCQSLGVSLHHCRGSRVYSTADGMSGNELIGRTLWPLVDDVALVDEDSMQSKTRLLAGVSKQLCLEMPANARVCGLSAF